MIEFKLVFLISEVVIFFGFRVGLSVLILIDGVMKLFCSIKR